MNRKWHNHNLYSVLESKTQTTKALIQHVFGVSDQETNLVRILKFRSPNRFTVLNKITSWTGDFFSVCEWRDVKIQDIDDSLFLKKNIVGGDIKSSTLIVRMLYFSVIHHKGILPWFLFFLYLQCIKTCNMKTLT